MMMRKRLMQALVGALLIAGTAGGLRAENSSSDGVAAATRLPQPLTLRVAVAQALRYNYAVQRAQAQVGVRRGEQRHASRWFPSNPEIEASVGRHTTPAGTASNDIGIRLAQEFWIAGQGGIREAAATARTDSARAKLDFLHTSIAARTRQAFLNLLAAREAVDTAKRVLSAVRAIREYSESRLEAGNATKLDSNTATIGVGRARAALARARSLIVQARLRLAELLAVDPADTIEIAGELTAPTLTLPNRRRLLKQAVQRRQDLAAAAKTVIAARQDLKLSKRQLIPNLTVFGFYRQDQDDDIAGLGVSLPLPLAHQYQGEQQSARAQLSQARINEHAVRLQVRAEVLGAVADYRSARTQFQALSKQVLNSAEQNVRLTREALQAGKLGAPAITTAQNNLFTVRQEYLAALRALISAGSELERATGGMLAMANAAPSKPNKTAKVQTP